MPSTLTRKIYEFEGFRLIPGEGLLFHNDTPINLNPKAFAVLAMLVEHHGHLVSKSEILDAIWEGAFIEEGAISKSIWFVRNALGDTSKERFIQTVPRRGYRFVAPVSVVEASGAFRLPDLPGVDYQAEELASRDQAHTNSAAVGAIRVGEPAAAVVSAKLNPEDGERVAEKNGNNYRNFPLTPLAVPASKWTVKRATAIALILLAGAATLTYFVKYRPVESTTLAGRKSIAVLPLKPINTANRDEIYEVGTADLLILKINSTAGLSARPLSAIRKYADVEQDPLAAGREQRADFVLASNYQLADGKVRITAQLFNVANGHIEETYKIEKTADDIFAMQDAVAGEIVNLLAIRFATTSDSANAKRGTANVEAYRLYFQGKNWTVKGGLSDAKKGIEYFQQAIQLDPNFARAYSGLAYGYIRSGHLGGGTPREEYEKALIAVTRALELDNNLAEGYRVLGEIKHVYEWDSAGAEKAWFRAFELEPNSESRYAGYLAESGRFDESVAAIDRMLENDPNSTLLRRERGRILYLARRYDEAIIQLKRVIELDENMSIASAFLQQAYDMKGDDAAAYEWFIREQKRTEPENIEMYQKAYAAAGWEAVIRKHLELEKRKENTPAGNYYRLARFSVRLNERERALEYLNRAIEKGHGQLRMLKVEPYFDPVRSDPRFNEVLRRIGW